VYRTNKWSPPRDVRFPKIGGTVTNPVDATADVYQPGGRTTADAY
jgi:hypothetical protein